MKRTLIAAFILCLVLCSCTDKAEPSGSFICGEAAAAALCDAGVFTASRGSVKCFDASGELIFERTLELGGVHITHNDSLAAAYADGGHCIVFSDGELISSEGSLISAGLSETGYLAVCAYEPGYMGSVTVYSPAKKAVYKWYSAHQALISAAVSPDGTRLAVLTDEALRLFSLDNEAERGSFDGTGLRNIVWLGERVCCIGESKVYVCNDEGKVRGKRELSGQTTGLFGELDRKLIIEVYESDSGENNAVYILDDSLNIKSRISPDGEVWCLECRNDNIALLTQNTVSVYGAEGRLRRSEMAMGANMVLLSDDGDTVTVGGGSLRVTEK